MMTDSIQSAGHDPHPIIKPLILLGILEDMFPKHYILEDMFHKYYMLSDMFCLVA